MPSWERILYADVDQLDSPIDAFGYRYNLNGAYYIPTADSCAICQAPSGLPCIAVLELDDSDKNPFNTFGLFRGPFVYEWDGAAWNMLADASSDGGLGVEQVNGTVTNEHSSGTITFHDWQGDTGTYSMREYDGFLAQPPMQDITSDGYYIYASWGHAEAQNGSGPAKERAYWKVKQWDGAAWTTLGGGANTHQGIATATPSSPPLGSLSYGNKLLASPEDVGHPYMLFVDRVRPGPLNTTYIFYWDGAVWQDFGNYLDVPSSPPSLFVHAIDFALGPDGFPTVVWGDTDSTFFEIPLVIATWDGAAWVYTYPDLNTLLAVAGYEFAPFKFSISPMEMDANGDPRHYISFLTYLYDPINDLYGTPSVYILEYYPLTQQIKPLLNDVTVARVGDDDLVPDPWDIKVLKPEVDEQAVWIFISSSGGGPASLLRYDNSGCNQLWQSEGPLVPAFPNFSITTPAQAYLDDAGTPKQIYSATLVKNLNTNVWQDHRVFVGDITTVSCDVAPTGAIIKKVIFQGV